MAQNITMYTPLPPLRERTHKYRVQISNDPIAGLQRFIDVQQLSIGGFSIALYCDVDFVDSDGNVINTERIKSYSHTLYASKDGPFVNLQGQRVEPEYDENGELIEGITTRYAFLMAMFDTVLPISLKTLECQFIQNADITLKEFDK